MHSFNNAKRGTVARDVTYAIMDGRGLKMDIYDPKARSQRDAPSFLRFHGEADAVEQVEQAHLLYTALSKAGARVHKFILRNAGHVFEPLRSKIWSSFNWTVAMFPLFLALDLWR